MEQPQQQTIVITGSTSGLGKATAMACLNAGANVIVSSESEQDLQATLEEFADFDTVKGIVCDVTRLEQVQALRDFALQNFQQIDCWINNAGTTAPSGDTVDVPIHFAELLIQTNLIGTYYGSITALRCFHQQGHGRLINITGRGEKSPQASANLYSSAKAWVRNFTLALAKEHQKSKLEIATFNPGLILTNLTSRPRVIKGKEAYFVKGLKTVMPIIGNSADKAGTRLAEIALSTNKIKKENCTERFLVKVMLRLLTGKRANVDVSTIEPVLIEAER